jgi:hypothetical protein
VVNSLDLVGREQLDRSEPTLRLPERPLGDPRSVVGLVAPVSTCPSAASSPSLRLLGHAINLMVVPVGSRPTTGLVQDLLDPVPSKRLPEAIGHGTIPDGWVRYF